MTSESAVLGLLADLYRDRAALQAENERLRAIVADLEQLAGKPDETP